MNVALIMTAVKLGATAANYCGVTELHKNAQGKLVGVKVKDELTGREFNVRAKVRPLFSSQRLVSHIQTGDQEVAPAEEDVRWVIDEVRGYLSQDIKVRRGDAPSAWSGLRPLISAGSQGGTEGLVRNHLVRVEPSGLMTIAGGKWTTYRAMAEETVDRAVEVFGLQDKVKGGCRTAELRLVGSDGWSRNMFIGLVQRVRLTSYIAFKPLISSPSLA